MSEQPTIASEDDPCPACGKETEYIRVWRNPPDVVVEVPPDVLVCGVCDTRCRFTGELQRH